MILRVGFLGTGSLASFLVRCLSREPDVRIMISPRNAARAAQLACDYGAEVGADNQDVIERSDLLMVCLPADAGAEVLAKLQFRTGQVVISAMAGVSHELVTAAVSPACAHLAMMPGHANALGLGPVVLYPSDVQSHALLQRFGPVISVKDEATFTTAATFGAVSGASFAWMVTMIRWFENHGLASDYARKLVAATLQGNAGVLLAEDTPLDDILAGVATPGGITELMVDSLEKHDALNSWVYGMTDVLHRLKAPAAPSD
ncbi:NAD(P)-binding domain-containing protein (plasmid) [Gemmobacter fulvus]|uniref:NAD(P)-binding domain-containing protein n=1 Tax=Gemmobacter fulvus TaxID=2840474 RepID=A0A975PCK6_9RHOB|nr:NAD(P)-binding domain-containing protein [Gemmobacter fulvus]MBT9247732.1 NAD(P)-binding domain-containing protein [Gemmobacter fulvus]QWK92911.1 NAD(P)-binding domain-containing protein [Gemmobacter fulvus]